MEKQQLEDLLKEMSLEEKSRTAFSDHWLLLCRRRKKIYYRAGQRLEAFR